MRNVRGHKAFIRKNRVGMGERRHLWQLAKKGME